MAHHGGEHEWNLTHAQVKEAYYVRRQYPRPSPFPAHPMGPVPKRHMRTKASRARND